MEIFEMEPTEDPVVPEPDGPEEVVKMAGMEEVDVMEEVHDEGMQEQRLAENAGRMEKEETGATIGVVDEVEKNEPRPPREEIYGFYFPQSGEIWAVPKSTLKEAQQRQEVGQTLQMEWVDGTTWEASLIIIGYDKQEVEAQCDYHYRCLAEQEKAEKRRQATKERRAAQVKPVPRVKRTARSRNNQKEKAEKDAVESGDSSRPRSRSRSLRPRREEGGDEEEEEQIRLGPVPKKARIAASRHRVEVEEQEAAEAQAVESKEITVMEGYSAISTAASLRMKAAEEQVKALEKVVKTKQAMINKTKQELVRDEISLGSARMELESARRQFVDEKEKEEIAKAKRLREKADKRMEQERKRKEEAEKMRLREELVRREMDIVRREEKLKRNEEEVRRYYEDRKEREIEIAVKQKREEEERKKRPAKENGIALKNSNGVYHTLQSTSNAALAQVEIELPPPATPPTALTPPPTPTSASTQPITTTPTASVRPVPRMPPSEDLNTDGSEPFSTVYAALVAPVPPVPPSRSGIEQQSNMIPHGYRASFATREELEMRNRLEASRRKTMDPRLKDPRLASISSSSEVQYLGTVPAPAPVRETQKPPGEVEALKASVLGMIALPTGHVNRSLSAEEIDEFNQFFQH